ncbi:uncharacterized protein LOC116004742, partial [Ipomoea triloba]|uniref:uncharacterized protein LOC116004742 n=1 Tax=Ipomoea triloba TaxID=35885 RepID=UPI00125D98A5
MALVLDKVVEEVASKAVNKLVQTVAANIDLVSGISSAVQHLTSDIETFNARLLDVSKNQSASDLHILRVAVKKFRAVVNEAQDAVAKYIDLNKRHQDNNALAKCFHKIPVPVCGNINVCAKEIKCIREKMKELLQAHEQDLISLMNYQTNEQDNALQPLQPVVEGGNATGFEKQVETLKTRLTGSSNNFIVIPIVGMPGTGKTTFAYQTFDSTKKLNMFVHSIWVHVSQGFNRKQKYIDILCAITQRPRDEYSGIDENQLAAKIKDHLNDKKYFIVLDDIWEKSHWDSLKEALPQNSKGSRVLVTTRFHSVVDSDEETYILKPLDHKVSWEILEKIVFGKDGCQNNDSLKTLGEDIAKICNGLPLSLVMVGGILRRSRALSYWKHVAENPFQEINRKDQRYHKVVRLSYDHLPHEKLKNCFLYFAVFPMGQEIDALKLIRLWIAEEFIPTIDEWGYSLDLEGEAGNYLKDLVDRNLVMVMKRSADGEIKTCRIHDSLHEFCKTEAAKNDLFHIIDGEQKLDANTISSHRRRLCFHSSSPSPSPSSSTAKIFDVEDDDPSCLLLNCACYNKMKKKKKKSPYPSGEHVHSLLLSSSQKSDIDLKQEELIAIQNAFPLLRVLDIQSFKLSFQLPNELFSLNLLRYLAITINFNLLPKAFKNLHELQTLVIKTTTRTLKISGGVWNMEKLRHVDTNASMQLPSPPQKTRRQNNTRKTNIRTLSSISPTSCQKEIFRMTPHLKKLGVRGNLVELLEEKPQQICLFNNLQMLKGLENLKLYGENEGAMGALKVPMLDMFAHRLRKLTFCNTFFKWDDIRILGSLEELEVLKLDENAFRGEEWDLKSDVVFNQLQYLRIGRTNLETWKIMENSFPVLENLVLRNCTNLKEIPSAFAQVHNLKVIELYHMSENANNSARQIAEQMSENANSSARQVAEQMSENANNSAGQVAEQMSENANNSAGQVAEQISENANNSARQLGEQRRGKENVKGLDLKITPLPPKATMAPGVEEDIVVGFGEEAKIIKDLLFIESMNLRVISIVGMIGMGKTTLARMLFNDVDLQYEFFTRIWVNVSRACDRRRIFYDILSRFTSISNDFHEMSEEHLAEKVKEYLKGSKYLIVLDDVWTEHDWFRLRIAFPNNVRGGKILVTTRSQDVASFIGSIGISHELKGLSDDECWELLEKKIFGDSRCTDTSLEAVGRSIAKKFEGVLLLVGKISDVLRENRTVAEWERIKSNPFASIEYENDEVMMEMINYDMMRDYSKMKVCLLYLAAFPRGFEIDARELVYLWVAEGLISGDDDLEYKAEYYIREFVRINLLMVVSRRTDDRIKRVRIHGFLHEICIREAAKPQNNFMREFQVEVEVEGGGAYGRGLFIHSSSSALALQAGISKTTKSWWPSSSSSDHVRSFLSFSSQGSIQEIAEEVVAAIPNAFPNLQVLNIRGFKFPNLPKELYRLKHLTYLGITIIHHELLPKEFGSLTQLQTLVLHTTREHNICVKIEADIWSMPNLRHLLTTTSRLQLRLLSPIIRRSSRIVIGRRKSSSGVVSKITTLSTISPTSCTPEILDKTPQIKKLGICGNLDELMDVNQEGVCLFDNLHKLDRLENLKLININDALESNTLGSFRFPPAESFPSRLRKMTLSNTSFQWWDFSVLGSLYTLEVLKLENNAFRGEFCDVSSVVFKQLQYFRIE